MATGSLGDPVHVGTESGPSVIRERRWLHRVVIGLLSLLVGLTVLDGLDVLDVVGPDEEVVRASGGGFDLAVEHPSVTRPALGSVMRFTVAKAGGFDEPLQLAVDRSYLEAWDVNGVLPAPSSETALGRWIVWEFDPPPGDELVVTYEARIEPGVQSSRSGAAAVMVDDEPVVSVDFSTAVRP